MFKAKSSIIMITDSLEIKTTLMGPNIWIFTLLEIFSGGSTAIVMNFFMNNKKQDVLAFVNRILGTVWCEVI